MEQQIEAWKDSYLQEWPELAEKQIEDYRTQGLDWHQIARERIFPFLGERMQEMRSAHDILVDLCEPVLQLATSVLNFDGDVRFVVHVGIGCGAGWATTFHDAPAILFGLENIAEEGWASRDVLTGLVAHEIGHLAYRQWQPQANESCRESPWSRLYDEGFAEHCEGLILKTGGPHQSMMEEDSDWLGWCSEHKGWLAGEFLRAVAANEPVSKFFGSWLEIDGKSETGYFLGLAVIDTLVAGGLGLREIAQLDPETTARPILDNFSRA